MSSTKLQPTSHLLSLLPRLDSNLVELLEATSGRARRVCRGLELARAILRLEQTGPAAIGPSVCEPRQARMVIRQAIIEARQLRRANKMHSPHSQHCRRRRPSELTKTKSSWFGRARERERHRKDKGGGDDDGGSVWLSCNQHVAYLESLDLRERKVSSGHFARKRICQVLSDANQLRKRF